MTAIRTLWGPIALGYGTSGSANANTLSLSDADNSTSAVFAVEKDGTIDRVGFYISAVGGTPPAYNVGLVTVDASGNPTTTAFGGSAVQSYTPTGTGWVWVTLGTPATVAAGDVLAARIWPGGTAPSATNFITVTTRLAYLTTNLPSPREWQSSWTKFQAYPCIAVRYSDDSAWPVVPLADTNISSPNFNSGTTPDELGSLLQIPFAASCIGARILVSTSAGADGTAKLYDGSDTLLASMAIDADLLNLLAGVSMLDVFWDSVSLAANTDYRLTVEATTVTNRIMGIWTVDSAASRAALPEGARWQKTERANAGAWTNTDTKCPIAGLWLTDATFGGGGPVSRSLVVGTSVMRASTW